MKTRLTKAEKALQKSEIETRRALDKKRLAELFNSDAPNAVEKSAATYR